MMIAMPGASYRGPLPPPTEEEAALAPRLRGDIEVLALQIGERNMGRPEALSRAAEFLERSLAEAGYAVERQTYEVGAQQVANLEAERRGGSRTEEIVIVGAHYDSIEGSPGADDNATGSAAVLALARQFARKKSSRTIRFVEFVNEEPPYFQTPAMGSWRYAQRCRTRRERIVAMLSLETIGYYADAPGTQTYPFPFNLIYPSRGNFIGFVSNLRSGPLVRQVIGSFRRQARFPSEGVATLASIAGVAWSDQWAFWEQGYPAVMVTDTAPFRYPYYHSAQDTPDKIDYERLARVVAGLARVIEELAGNSR